MLEKLYAKDEPATDVKPIVVEKEAPKGNTKNFNSAKDQL